MQLRCAVGSPTQTKTSAAITSKFQSEITFRVMCIQDRSRTQKMYQILDIPFLWSATCIISFCTHVWINFPETSWSCRRTEVWLQCERFKIPVKSVSYLLITGGSRKYASWHIFRHVQWRVMYVFFLKCIEEFVHGHIRWPCYSYIYTHICLCLLRMWKKICTTFKTN